jgi:hypothetical protein
MAEINGIVKLVSEDWIRQLPSVLREDELPEKMLAVDYRGDPNCMIVVTNFRVMFLSSRLLSMTKFKVRDFPCYEITKVDFKPGMLKHRVTIHRGKKKEEFHGQVLEGKDRARMLAEHLATKVPGADSSIAQDAKSARRFTLDELAREYNIPTSVGGFSGALNHLTSILEDDDMPHTLATAVYDDRKGLNLSGATLEIGVLALTKDRLLHVAKPPVGRAKTVSIAYEDIERVTFTKGMMLSSLSAWVNGAEEKFDKMGRSDGEKMAHHLEGKIG